MLKKTFNLNWRIGPSINKKYIADKSGFEQTPFFSSFPVTKKTSKITINKINQNYDLGISSGLSGA